MQLKRSYSRRLKSRSSLLRVSKPLHDVLTVQLISLSKPVDPKIIFMVRAFRQPFLMLPSGYPLYLFLPFRGQKKDAASIPNAGGKGIKKMSSSNQLPVIHSAKSIPLVKLSEETKYFIILGSISS